MAKYLVDVPWPVVTNRPTWPFQLNPSSPQARGLLGWWPTGVGSSGTIFDLSPHGLHGTVQAASAVRGVPQHGLTQYFNGSSWANTPSAPAISGTQPFTMSCWYEGVSGGGYNSYDVVLWTYTETGGHSDTTNDKAIGFRAGGGASTQPFIYVYDGSAKRLYASSGQVLDVGPVLIVGTFNGSQLEIYLNGVSRGTLAASGSYAFSTPQIVWSLGILAIYQDVEGQAWDYRLYDYALSAGQVSALYNDRWDLYQVHQPRLWVDIGAAVVTDWLPDLRTVRIDPGLTAGGMTPPCRVQETIG